jgi:hypothetical protein
MTSMRADNALTIGCAEVGQRMHYAACLNRLAKIDSGKYPADWDQCRKLAQSDMCKAQRMRTEEEGGQIVHFVARAPQPVLDGYRMRDAEIAPATPEPVSVTRIETNIGAAAINAALTGQPTSTSAPPCAPEPALRVSVSVAPAMEPGETPLAYARRLAQLKEKV